MSSIGSVSAASLSAPPASGGVGGGVLAIANKRSEIVLRLLEDASQISQAIQSQSTGSSGSLLDKVV